MFGGKGDDGIITRAVDDVFAIAKKRAKKCDINMKVSILELYEDELTDLMAASSEKRLIIKKDVKGLVHVVNSSFTTVTSTDLLKECLTNALKKRDGLGHDASKSNMFVTITVECSNKDSGVVNNGRIVFSDLMGCDTGEASCGALLDVVKALEAEDEMIPYTACPMTKLLSDCLGGNAKTLVIVHVKPDVDAWGQTKKVNLHSYALKVAHEGYM